jgi:hypothetical protein
MNSRRQRALRCEVLEKRELLTVNASPFEQALLEDINRFRQDPAGELEVIFSSIDPELVARDSDVQIAIDFFDVNREVLLNQWAQLEPAPPLAWNEQLTEAAAAHSQLMIDLDMQEHVLPGELSIGDRITATGYDFQTASENIFAYAESHLHTHAGFIVDWGTSSTGIQQPPGHRNNILDTRVTEVGISVLAENSARTGVGPFVVTQDFGEPQRAGNPFLLGVAWSDADGNEIYDPGEGLAGVTLTIRGNGRTFQTTTLDAGGYQIRLEPGTYSVEASGGQLAVPMELSEIIVGGTNVKADIEGVAAIPPSATNDSASSLAAQPVTISVLANDVAPTGTLDPSTLAIVDQANFGEASVDANNGTITYTPNAGFSGADNFRYTVRDSQGNVSNEATVTINVSSAGWEPVADFAVGYSGESVAITPLVNDTAAAGTPTIVITVAPSHGTATVRGSSITYTSDPDFVGQDTLQYGFANGTATPTDVAPVTLTVADRARAWQNPIWNVDVDADGQISPLDAILVINQIGENVAQNLNGDVPPPWTDVDGDNAISPIDAILVINALENAAPSASSGTVVAPLSTAAAVRDEAFAEEEEDDNSAAAAGFDTLVVPTR